MAGSNAAGSFGPFVDRTWSSSLYSDRPERVDRPSLAPMPATTSVSGSRSPSHPAHGVASVPLVAHHYPASAIPVLYPCGTTRSAASDLTTADFAGSILLEDQSRRVTALPAKPSVVPFSQMSDCLRGSGSRFSSKRKPIASFPEMGRNEHHAHHT